MRIDARMLTFGLPNQKEAMDGIMFNFIELGTLVPDANSRARFSFFLMGTNVPAQQSRFDAIDGTCIPSSMLTR